MAGVRILVELSSKAFFEALGQEGDKGSFESVVNRVIKIQDCNTGNPDYGTYISQREESFVLRFNEISQKHGSKLTKDVKKNIQNSIKDIDLDMFVHNPNIIGIGDTVVRVMEIFAPLLNYIFDILIYINISKNAEEV